MKQVPSTIIAASNWTPSAAVSRKIMKRIASAEASLAEYDAAEAELFAACAFPTQAYGDAAAAAAAKQDAIELAQIERAVANYCRQVATAL